MNTTMKANGEARSEQDVLMSALRAALAELVRLKDFKLHHGETEDYRTRRDQAWHEARRVLDLR